MAHLFNGRGASKCVVGRRKREKGRRLRTTSVSIDLFPSLSPSHPLNSPMFRSSPVSRVKWPEE
ncbi:Uncharacterized protein APZ42_018546 [Daphnia magna]|uniref:Uncharacterized protein n=1 Tax=Daphnia magna TaxID=35525 RepID=A0A0N8ECF4_9CRUS|nr:Uncharacterized protein APZ42_018546 [Daphnia magna]